MSELERLLGGNRAVVVKPSLEVEKIVPWETAVILVMFKEGYPLLNRTGVMVRSEKFELPMPLVVANYAHREPPRRERYFRSDDTASKTMIRERDSYTCQYCGGWGDTIDHIVPRSLGGKSVWGNLCVACRECNQAKGCKSINEVGFKYPSIPDKLPAHTYRRHRLQEALITSLESAV